MANDIIEITEETKEKLRDFDEQEAYFLLCQIVSYAQATGDYARFQSDLAEWKKRYPVDLFSDEFKSKIKYMLSKEFLDTVLKNFVAFDELSKKDPSQGLEMLRKILGKAEKHKDEKQLDKDLEQLYKEYPLKFLKEKYPHVVNQLLSKSNRTRILEKFDSSLAFKELENITANLEDYKDISEFKSAIEEWQKLYPTADFNDKYKSQVEQTLSTVLDEKNLNELFPVSNELDLSEGQVIPIELNIQNISLISKDALHDFFNIVDSNKNDIDSLFNWICKYSKYINGFEQSTKEAIVNNLMVKYAYELPSTNTKYEIPKMDTNKNDLLSLSDFKSIDNTKRNVVLQTLGILSTGKELTHEDKYRLQVINSNAQKAQIIEEAYIDPKVELFMQDFPEDKLTPSDEVYFKSILSKTTPEIQESPSHPDNSQVEEIVPEPFKETLKVSETLEKVETTSATSTSSESSTSSGGTSVAITPNDEIPATQETEENDEIDKIDEQEKSEEIPPHNPLQNFFKHFIKHEPQEEKDIDDDYER